MVFKEKFKKMILRHIVNMTTSEGINFEKLLVNFNPTAQTISQRPAKIKYIQPFINPHNHAKKHHTFLTNFLYKIYLLPKLSILIIY